MRIGTALKERLNYTQAVAKRSGDLSRIVGGDFDDEYDAPGNGPDVLLHRFGFPAGSTAGSLEGEAKEDPEVLRKWLLDASSPLGGPQILGHFGVTAGQIDNPDTDDTRDMMYISANGVTTAYGDLIRPWLIATNGGQVQGATGASVASGLEDAAAQVAKLATALAFSRQQSEDAAKQFDAMKVAAQAAQEEIHRLNAIIAESKHASNPTNGAAKKVKP